MEQKKLITHPDWLELFDNIIEHQTAGLPQNVDVKWTDLSCTQIVAEFNRKGIPMSRYLVNQMLDMRGYKKRKLLKMDTLSQTEQRNEQFEKLNLYRDQFTNMNFPVLSIDTKKKEMLGNFCRPGTCYSQSMRRVNDHDFASCSDGIESVFCSKQQAVSNQPHRRGRIQKQFQQSNHF